PELPGWPGSAAARRDDAAQIGDRRAARAARRRARDPGPDRQRPPGPGRRQRPDRPRDQRLRDQADRFRPAARDGRRADGESGLTRRTSWAHGAPYRAPRRSRVPGRRRYEPPARPLFRCSLSPVYRHKEQLDAPPLAPRHLEPDLLAFQLGAVEEFDRALGLVGVDLDEGEAVQDADVVDGLVGQDGALAERPAEVLLVDPAALAAVDEELGGLLSVLRVAVGRRFRDALGLRLLGRGVVTVGGRLCLLRLTLLTPPLARTAFASAWRRRVLEPLLRALPLADFRVDVALDAADLVALLRRHE